MSSNPQTHLMLLLLLAMAYRVGAVTIGVGVRNRPFTNTIFLNCKEGDTDLTNVEYIRTIGQEDTKETFTNYEVVGDDNSVKFELTPSLEGNYSCIDSNSNTTSSNYVTLIAYPTMDPSFTYPQYHTAVVGMSTPPLPCPYLPGLLLQYYTIEWWRGLVKLDTSTAKYQILQNFSLIVYDSAISDVSAGYICKIVVNDIEAGKIYTEYGPDISLTVDGGLKEVDVLSNKAVLKGSEVRLSCSYEGYPIPDVTWLLNSQKLTSNVTNINISSSNALIALQSTLTVISADTGKVQCIGIANGRVTSSDALLIALDYDFTPVLAVAGNTIRLQISLPDTIPDVFSLHLRYSNVSKSNLTHDIIVRDASFSRTNTVNYTLSSAELPPQFPSFTLCVALEVYNVVGQFSHPSDPIDYLPMTTPTPAPISPTGVCDVTVYTVIIVVLVVTVVVMIVAIVAIIIVLCWCSPYSKRRRPMDPVTYDRSGSQIYSDPEFYGDCKLHDRKPHQKDHIASESISITSSSSSSSDASSPSHSGCCHGNGDLLSRPSSQESYSYDHSATASPVHDKNGPCECSYDNSIHRHSKMTDSKQQHHEKYDPQRKGHSVSPHATRHNNNDVALGTTAKVKQEAEKAEGKVSPLSPSRSEPVLDTTDAESSLASTVGLSASVAMTTNSQQGATMPTTQKVRSQGIPTTELPTFHEYMGTIHAEVAPPTDTKQSDQEYIELISEFEMVETPI